MEPAGRRHEDPDSRGSVAFVLPGGATRGAAQVGMLLALAEAGIRPDFTVGTSIGALNASCYTPQPTVDGLRRLERLWVDAPRPQIFPFSPLPVLRNLVARRGYVLSNDGLRAWIESNTEFERLEDYPLPVHAIATDVETREPVVLSTGAAVPALLASCAIPGVFPPIEIDGRLLCDGAVAADTPLDQAVALGATTIYVLPTMVMPSTDADDREQRRVRERWGPLSPATAAAVSFHILDQVFGRSDQKAPPDDPPGVVVHRLRAPRIEAQPFGFGASRQLIESAHQLTTEWLSGRPSVAGR